MSDSDCNPPLVKLFDFKIGTAGPTSGTITGNMPISGGDGPVSQVTINNNPDLSKIIIGPKGGSIKSIFYESMDGIARNSVIRAYGQGPDGSGSIKLYFWTKDHPLPPAKAPHDMTISSGSPDCHGDKFDDGSDILQISWEAD